MAVFAIETPQGRFQVEAPDEQAAFRALQSMAPQAKEAPKEVDPIRAEVLKEYEADKAKGVPIVGNSLTRRIAQGATFNAADEILAGALTPIEMIKRKTWNPATGYQYAKARQDIELEKARDEQGWTGSVAELLGGMGSGIGLARGGLTAMRALAPNAGIGARTAASAADGAILGSVAGGMEGNSLDDRSANAALGLISGGMAGAAMPAAGSAFGLLASPIISNIRARINPQGYATTQLARAITESGRTGQQIADDVAMAARDGQDVFTVADALGNPGQRMLSTVARAPGQGRTEAVEFLERRQAGQGRRVANTLAEGLDAPVSAERARTGLTQRRDAAADTAYDAVRQNAGPVDLSQTVATIDRTLAPGVNQVVQPAAGRTHGHGAPPRAGTMITSDSAEGALASIRSRLTDGRSLLSDFAAVQRVRGDLADMIAVAQRAGQGNRVRLLSQVRAEMDRAMEDASQGFRDANRQYSAASRVIDTLDEGATAATRGRTEDIIPQFRGLNPSQQEAFRIGYADPLIAQTQGAAQGVNKARPFTSDAFQAEASAIAPMRTGPQMMRRLDRENTMFATRNQALGGSRTADNLADADAMGIDPSIITNLLSGRLTSAAQGLLSAGSNALTGNTAQVRESLARMLLARGQVQNVRQAIAEAQARIDRTRLTMGLLSRGVMGAGAAALPTVASSGR